MKKKTHTQVLVEAHVKAWGFWSALIAIAGTVYFTKTRLDIKQALDVKVAKLEAKLSAYEYNSKRINRLIEYQGKIENHLFIIEEKLYFPSQNTFNLQKVYTLSDELEQQIDNLVFKEHPSGSKDMTTLSFSLSGEVEDIFYLVQEFRSRMWYNQIDSLELLNRSETQQTMNISFDLLNAKE